MTAILTNSGGKIPDVAINAAITLRSYKRCGLPSPHSQQAFDCLIGLLLHHDEWLSAATNKNHTSGNTG
jgi:hypothetical protein